jgi:DNA polymerase-1
MDVRFLWHNGQFDIKWFWHNGIPEARVDEDTILLSYSLDENGGIHGLEQVSSDWLNSPNWKAVIDSYLPKKDSSYELVPRDILHKYMAYDIGNTRADYDILRPRVAADPYLEKLYTRTLIPATNFLAKVESNGIFVDVERLRENQQWYDAEVKKAAAPIHELGKQFPGSKYTEKLPGSWQQIQRLLYDDLKIKPYKNKKSTDQKTLEQLPSHPAIAALRRHRKVAKERGTYVTSLANFRDKKTGEYNVFIPGHLLPDGKVHSSLALFKTRTGRLASSDPNVQNVPRNPQIRGQYVASPGKRFIECDLNQAELRVLATISGDPELCRIYLTAGMSLHDEVRASIWGYPKDWSDKLLSDYLYKFRLTQETRYDENGKDLLLAEQKMRAKNVNFGTVYGITAAGLAEQCDCSVQEAQEMLNAWFKKFKLAGNYIQACKNAPLHGRTLITAFGRKKRPGIVSAELAQGIQNEFANFPEQSPASDITLHSGIELEPVLREQYDTRIVNLIHDALLLECPDDDNVAREVAALTCKTMSEVPKKWGFKKIPFLAEAKQGYRWGSLKDLKLAA